MESSGDQHTQVHIAVSFADARGVHTRPSGLVMTRSVVAGGLDSSPATATNSDSSGDQHTLFQSLATTPSVRGAHVMPSELVITRTPSPLYIPATATNRESSGDQHTDVHMLALTDSGVARITQL